MRLFAAVLPPSDALAELGAAVDRLEELPGAADLRWTGRAGWHFTLVFLGEVPEEAVPELTERLGEVAEASAPFRLALSGGGQFGDRALWAGAGCDVSALRRLADRATRASRTVGLEPNEDRGFHPHLTVARTRRAAPRDLAPYVAGLDGFSGTEWTVGELCLMRSLPAARGDATGDRSHYETAARWPLTGAG